MTKYIRWALTVVVVFRVYVETQGIVTTLVIAGLCVVSELQSMFNKNMLDMLRGNL